MVWNPNGFIDPDCRTSGTLTSFAVQVDPSHTGRQQPQFKPRKWHEVSGHWVTNIPLRNDFRRGIRAGRSTLWKIPKDASRLKKAPNTCLRVFPEHRAQYYILFEASALP